MELPSVLYEVTIRLSNETLRVLSRTPLWNDIASASRDQNWWFARTEYLTGRSLTYRMEDWASVYRSLSENGLTFHPRHNYRSTLLIQVLLEIGADPSVGVLLPYVVVSGNVEGLAILLSDTRVDLIQEDDDGLIVVATEHGLVEIVKLLLEDGRTDPSYYDDEAIKVAAREHETEIVRLLLSDKRVDPSTEKNTALRESAKYGYADIFELLLSDKRVHEVEGQAGDNYFLENAIVGSHSEVVKLILVLRDISLRWVLGEACKGSSFEVVKLLFNDYRVLAHIDGNYPLRMARNGKRQDVIDLLLSDPQVRELDDK